MMVAVVDELGGSAHQLLCAARSGGRIVETYGGRSAELRHPRRRLAWALAVGLHVDPDPRADQSRPGSAVRLRRIVERCPQCVGDPDALQRRTSAHTPRVL